MDDQEKTTEIEPDDAFPTIVARRDGDEGHNNSVTRPISSEENGDEEPSAERLGLTWLVILSVLVAVTINLASFPLLDWLYRGRHASPPVIVVVDSDQLISDGVGTFTDLMRAGEIEPEEMVEKTAAFTTAMFDVLEELKNQNVLVLRRETVLMKPPSVQDLTNDVRDVLREDGVLPSSTAAE